MEKLETARKRLALVRWAILAIGVGTTLVGWFTSGQMTPMIMLPTTLGVLGFVTLYVLWAIVHMHYTSVNRQEKFEKRMTPRRVIWEKEVCHLMRN
ncbi:MAG: hypothetical protein AAGA18_01965 [Verrucomicrobiota bacterium]